MKLPVSETNDP